MKDNNILRTALISILVVVILLKIYAAILPEAQSEGDDWALRGTELTSQAGCEDVSCFWNATRGTDCTQYNVSQGDTTQCPTVRRTMPLASVFAGSGVVFLIVMIALALGIIMTFMGKKNKF